MSAKGSKRKGSVLCDQTGSVQKKNKKTVDVPQVNQSMWKPLGDMEELVHLLKTLSTAKKLLMKSLGFEALLYLHNIVIRKTMCRWVIDHFDPSTCTLEAYGDKVKITPRHVEYLIGLKDHGYEIELVKVVEEASQNNEILRFTQMDVKRMGTELRKIPHNSPHFKAFFTLFMMTTLCSPTVDKKPRREWIHLVLNDNAIPHWNFASYLFKETVDAVAEFKSQSTPKSLGGCPLFLMAIFCEYSPKDRLESIWKFDLPRIRDWSDIDTKALHDTITKLPRGYRSNKLMGLIEKDKLLISGKVPSTHAENVEKAFSATLDEVDRLGSDLNKMFKLFVDYVDRQETGNNAVADNEEEVGSDGSISCSEGEEESSKGHEKKEKVERKIKRSRGKKTDVKVRKSGKVVLVDDKKLENEDTRKGSNNDDSNTEDEEKEDSGNGLNDEKSTSLPVSGGNAKGELQNDVEENSDEGRQSKDYNAEEESKLNNENDDCSELDNCKSKHDIREGEADGDITTENAYQKRINKQGNTKKKRKTKEVTALVEKKAHSRSTRHVDDEIEEIELKSGKKLLESELKSWKSETRVVVRYVLNNTLDKEDTEENRETQSNARNATEPEKDNEEMLFEANSLDVASPASHESAFGPMEQYTEARSTSVAQGNIFRAEIPSPLVPDIAKQAFEMPSTSATNERIRTEMPSSSMHVAEKASCLETLRPENHNTHSASQAYINFINKSKENDNSTVKFEGMDIKSNLCQTLQTMWSKHGNLIEKSIIRTGDLVARALESLATVVLILEGTSVRALSDSQADYLKTTLSDLQCMHFKVEWLVPYVEKATQLHKSKPLVDSRDQLVRCQAKLVERKAKLAEEFAELNKLEKELEEDVTSASRLTPFSGNVDFDQPVGCGLS